MHRTSGSTHYLPQYMQIDNTLARFAGAVMLSSSCFLLGWTGLPPSSDSDDYKEEQDKSGAEITR